MATPTPDPHTFPFSTISSCMCYLLSSLLRRKVSCCVCFIFCKSPMTRKISGVHDEDVAQNLLEERFLRDKIVKIIEVFMMVLCCPLLPILLLMLYIGTSGYCSGNSVPNCGRKQKSGCAKFGFSLSVPPWSSRIYHNFANFSCSYF